jgi:aspartyl protease family protein
MGAMSEKAFLGIIAACTVLGLVWPDGKDAPPVASAPSTKPGIPKPAIPPRLAQPQTSNGFSTFIERAPDGHFYAEARVNNQPVRFMIDTGASAIALTANDARRIGLAFDRSEFMIVGKGASGEVMGKPVMLDSVEIDGKAAQHIRAAILDEGLDVSLLGQAYLAQLGEVKIVGNRMELR